MKSFFIYFFSLFICTLSYGQIKSTYSGFGNIKNNYNSLTSLSKQKQTSAVKLPEITKVYYSNPNFKKLNKKAVFTTKIYPYFSMNHTIGVGVTNYSNYSTTNSSYKPSTAEIIIDGVFTVFDLYSFFSFY